MDLVSSALSLAISAADATTSLHKLCKDWPDCPYSINELINDLERANIFLYVSKLPLSNLPYLTTLDDCFTKLAPSSNLIKSGLETPMDSSLRSHEDEDITLAKIGYILTKEERIIARIQELSSLLLVNSSSGSNKIRRLIWLENFPVISRLRRALKNNVACVYTLLVLKHMCATLKLLNPLQASNTPSCT